MKTVSRDTYEALEAECSQLVEDNERLRAENDGLRIQLSQMNDELDFAYGAER